MDGVTTLGDLLFAGSDDPGALLLHTAGRDHSLAEVRDRATDIACLLADAGADVGAPIGVMLPDAEVVPALFGVWRLGGAYVPLNPRLGDADLAHVLDSVDPVAVVTTADQAGRFGDRPIVLVASGRNTASPVAERPSSSPAGRPAEPAGTVRGAGSDTAGPEADRSLSSHPSPAQSGGVSGTGRVTLRPGTPGTRRFDPDVALVQFTSGTTGRPKPVLLNHTGVLALLENVVASLRKPSGGRGDGGPRKPPMPNLVPVSMSLWAGIYQVLFARVVGAPVVVMNGFDTVDFARLVGQFAIRSTVLPPPAMVMLCDDERITSLAPLRYVRSIAAPLSPLQARRFRDRFGLAVLNCYGQTEIGGEIIGWTAADSKAHPDKLGAVGRPNPGVQARIDDATGELHVLTPALSAGYADGNDLGDRLTDDGWFRTGDVGLIDGDGFVWIEGRLSDMINRGGLKVFPGEVEEVLRLSADVADVAVAGLPDDRLGEVPWAFVVPAAGRTPDPDALAALCREHLAPYKVPVRFEAVDELPRNAVGKVLTRELVAGVDR